MMNDIAQGRRNARDVRNYFLKMQRRYPKGSYPMQFTCNHDENSWQGTVFERLGDAVETMAALTFTVPGIPLIYSGQEAGLNKRLAFFEKDEIDWSDLSMQEFYQDLIRLKKENPALWNGAAGGEIRFLDTDDFRTLAFVREKEDNRVIHIANLSKEPLEAEIWFEGLQGIYEEFLQEEEITLGKGETFELAPWEYRIFIQSRNQ